MDGFPDMSGALAAAADRLLLFPGAPLISAREFLKRHHVASGTRTLHHQGGAFFGWHTTHYAEVTTEEVRADLYGFLDKADRPGEKEGETAPFAPNKSKVGNVLEALAAEAQLPMSARPPSWLAGKALPDAREILSCANGLLHLPSRKLFPHTADFFTLNALDFSYQADAQQPTEWLKFLGDIWPNDPQSIAMLQEMFGLLLTGDTSYQKAFLLVGPKRSGKGTIARVLTKMLGQPNVCGPTLSSLGQNFGIAPLIGKRLAIISDARLGGKTDQQVVVERILAITGEDSISVPRKFRDDWTGQLETRMLVLTNELPRLADASGALASRFLILTMSNSFYGREDQGLTERLTQELPGILNWSLAGWERLQTRRHFIQPTSAAEAQRDFEDLGSPMSAFIRDCCEVGPAVTCKPDAIYNAWLGWCRDQNITHPGTVQTFGRDLRSVVSSLKTPNFRNDSGGRDRFYQGIKLRDGKVLA
jgi:putative DNA primase/helicase